MTAARIIAIILGLAGVLIGAIQAAKPEALGITPLVSAWLGVAGAAISGWQMLLPPVHKSDR